MIIFSGKLLDIDVLTGFKIRHCPIICYSSQKVWGEAFPRLGKGILDSLYLLIPLINNKSQKMKPWSHPTSSFKWVKPGTKRQNTLLSFIVSLVHDHSTKNYGPHWFILFYFHTTIWQIYMVLFHLFFLLHMAIQPKYMVLFFYSVCCALLCNQELWSLSIYFFYLHTTIRPTYMVLFHLFFLLKTTIWPKDMFLFDLFFL